MLTAQAAIIATLTAEIYRLQHENDQLKRVNAVLRAMQALIDAKAAKTAVLDRDLPRAWRVA